MPASWDLAELDALEVTERRRQSDDFARRLELLPPGAPYRGRLLRLPGDPGTPAPRPASSSPAPAPPAHRWPDGAAASPVELPPAPSAAWVAQVRALYRDKLVTRTEARALLGLPRLSLWRRCPVVRAARRALRRWSR